MPLRTIRNEAGVEEQIRKLGIGFKRYDEMMDFVQGTLCEHPETFPVITGTRISLVKTNEFVGASFRDIPSLAIYFHYDEKLVRIISVETNDLESYGICE